MPTFLGIKPRKGWIVGVYKNLGPDFHPKDDKGFLLGNYVLVKRLKAGHIGNSRWSAYLDKGDPKELKEVWINPSFVIQRANKKDTFHHTDNGHQKRGPFKKYPLKLFTRLDEFPSLPSEVFRNFVHQFEGSITEKDARKWLDFFQTLCSALDQRYGFKR